LTVAADALARVGKSCIAGRSSGARSSGARSPGRDATGLLRLSRGADGGALAAAAENAPASSANAFGPLIAVLSAGLVVTASVGAGEGWPLTIADPLADAVALPLI
jgi:hypothetical protein